MSLHLHGRPYTAEEMRQRFGHLKHEFGVFAARAPEAMREDPTARYAIIKGDSFTTWETSRDAHRYANLAFGGQPYFCQELSDRGLEAVLGIFPEFRSTPTSPGHPCPPSGTLSAGTAASSESVSA